MKELPILKFDTFYGLRKGSLSYAVLHDFLRMLKGRKILTNDTFWRRLSTGKEQGKGYGRAMILRAAHTMVLCNTIARVTRENKSINE